MRVTNNMITANTDDNTKEDFPSFGRSGYCNPFPAYADDTESSDTV